MSYFVHNNPINGLFQGYYWQLQRKRYIAMFLEMSGIRKRIENRYWVEWNGTWMLFRKYRVDHKQILPRLQQLNIHI